MMTFLVLRSDLHFQKIFTDLDSYKPVLTTPSEKKSGVCATAVALGFVQLNNVL